MVLKDACGRPLLNLRIAVTRKCNLNCSFCHGEGEERHEKNTKSEMTVGEIAKMAKIAVGLGIRRIKLTGGEPLTRKDIVEVVEELDKIPDLEDLSMTTNGSLLSSLAEELCTSGLKRVNISVPTLDEDVYRTLTGGRVDNVLRGVKAAVEVGFFPVKLNMLILKGINDLAVPEMINFAKETGAILQLIELEPINVSDAYYSARHKPLDTYEKTLKQDALKVETREYMHNRHVYYLPDVQVEVIHPIENTEFCLNCTRLRATSDGRLKPCLMRNDNTVDILTPMRNGANPKELIQLFEKANMNRQPYNSN